MNALEKELKDLAFFMLTNHPHVNLMGVKLCGTKELVVFSQN